MISFAQASVLHPEVLVTAESGRIKDEHWQNPTIIATYSLSFDQDRYSTDCNMVPKLREHKITANALIIQAQMNLGFWTCSCKSEIVNIWSLEESSLESWAELVCREMKRTKYIYAANVNHPVCCQNRGSNMEVKWWGNRWWIKKGDEI